jgi:hypothetical protein
VWAAVTLAKVLRDALSREKGRGKRNPPDSE